MNHNDVLRRLRYALDLPDAKVLDLFRLGEAEITREQLNAYLAHEGDAEFVEIPDRDLIGFLDGLVLDRRGPPAPGAPARAKDTRADNNLVLKKLRIALNLQEQQMLELLRLGGMPMSASELTALFRKPDHKHYRPAGDQLLRNFLKGLTTKLRPG
jgi:uncharacterized protein YehS (DUF1456 family)